MNGGYDNPFVGLSVLYPPVCAHEVTLLIIISFPCLCHSSCFGRNVDRIGKRDPGI